MLDELNQYYTDSIYCDSLISSLNSTDPRLALDLGFGAGDLLYAAKRRWKDIDLIGVDIDSQNILNAQNKKVIKSIEQNGLSLYLPDVIRDKYGEIDLLISNPPYYSLELDYDRKAILKEAGLEGCISKTQKTIPAELVFLAQNLRLLSKQGEIGIVLPSGLISGKRWQPFRDYLFSNYLISKVIQMPTNSFRKTDAQTFILIFSNLNNSLNDTIKVGHVLDDVDYEIPCSQAIIRSDYQYYKQFENCSYSKKAINKNDFKIFRGNQSHNFLKNNTNYYLHTTTLPVTPSVLNLPTKILPNTVVAQKGDIVLARVGRRCLGRIARIESGTLPISDCIIGVRGANVEKQELLWEKLSSKNCFNYLNESSFGVSAKYITHELIIDYLTNTVLGTY